MNNKLLNNGSALATEIRRFICKYGINSTTQRSIYIKKIYV